MLAEAASVAAVVAACRMLDCIMDVAIVSSVGALWAPLCVDWSISDFVARSRVVL